jgi:hypothetical protein
MLKMLTFSTIMLIYISGASALICKIGQSVCGGQCYYDVGLHTCVEGHLCKIGQSVCGGQCYYDVALQTCIDGHLCKIGQKLCNQQCYYPIGQQCINRRWLI